MNYDQLSAKHKMMKQRLRNANDALIRRKKVKPIDIANSNSCFAGVNLHAARNGKGFNLF
ncbi:MAG: hypothetical protein JKY93_02560 [Gammaproteobacteria bacterium]|nr:hypothetical protein [Gammaproteobacteria bacterium]